MCMLPENVCVCVLSHCTLGPSPIQWPSSSSLRDKGLVGVYKIEAMETIVLFSLYHLFAFCFSLEGHSQ